ncbi:MAG: dienelactone hydrolase family protein, partial [Stenotrophomonas maltophilia]
MNRQWRWGAAVLLGMTALPALAAMQAKPVEWTQDGTTFSG